MFESAELGHSISDRRFTREAPLVREALLTAQYALKDAARFPVVVVFAGVDGAGKGETVNLLSKWMDPRLLRTHAFDDPTRIERDMPDMWRFWSVLPAKGSIGILDGGWYTGPILDRALRKIKASELTHSIEQAVAFERMLVNEGTLLLKFWFHLSKADQKDAFRCLEQDPGTRWRVTEADWKRHKLYDKLRKVAAHTLSQTNLAEAPWTLVEGRDAHYRNLTVAQTILDAVNGRLAAKAKQPKPSVAAPALPIDEVRVLDRLDLSVRLPKKQYEKELDEWQCKLNMLMREPKLKRNHGIVAVFEGPDAAGKGGSIRHVTPALDARHYSVIPIAAPTDEERAQPYLWRFWRHLPRRGHTSIYDRSWYGRVLVERVEELCSEADWLRAYDEINDFERQLHESGMIVVKFWLAISKEEQLARFKAREETAFKRFKLGKEDWRNRKKWHAYSQAVHDMVERTSTEAAPWTLVEADDKLYARIKVLKTLVKRIEDSL